MDQAATDNRMTRFELISTVLQRVKIQLSKRWWILMLCAAVAVCFQAWLISNKPVTFISYARIVSGGTISVNNSHSGYMENRRDFFGTQIELMQSGEVRRRALERIEATHPDVEPVPVELDVTRTRESSIFNLQAVGDEPEYTQIYLDSILDEFIGFRREMKEQLTDTTLNQITEELLRLERELKSREADLEEFHGSNNVVLLEGNGNKAAEYLFQLRAERRTYEKQYQLYELFDFEESIEMRQKLSEDGGIEGLNLSYLNLGTSEREFLKTKQELQLLESDMAARADVYKLSHPVMIRWQEEVDRKKLILAMHRDASMESIKKQKNSLGLQIQNLDASISEWEQKALDTSTRLNTFKQITTDLGRTKSLYENLLKSLRELDLSKSLERDSLSVMERATTSVELRPSTVGPIVSGFGFGLALGIGILVLVDRLDDRMNTLAEFQAHFGEDILGHIPRQNAKDGSPMLQPDDERHVFAESYRNLRSSILFKQWGEEPPKLMLITSAIPSEGKTTTAANLAITMATAGAKTLCVDCDLRRGSLQKNFEIKNGLGVGEILTGEIPWSDTVVPTKTPNLYFIGRGKPPQTSEFLLSSITPQFLKEIRDAYDYVIIDSAPIMVADDTTSLAPFVDTCIFVVKLSLTSARLVAQSLDQLYDRQVNIGGVVLNQTNGHLRDYNYYNYYSYYSTHGYLDYYTSR